MSELKPCPFCGSKSRQIWVSTFTEEKMTGCSNSDCEYFRNEYPVDWWQSRPIEDELRAELARRDEIIKRLVEDAERLAIVETEMTGYEDEYEEVYCLHSGSCGSRKYQKGVEFIHTPNCPITLHRALMKKLEER